MKLLAILRSLLFTAVFYVETAVILLLGSPLLFGPRRYAMMGLKTHALVSLWFLEKIVGTRLEVRGRENLPPGPVLIASKHQSAWDTFGLIPLFHDPAMVMKKELGLVPLYGWFSYKFEHVMVERASGPAALRRLIRDTEDRARQGREIVIFPEGTRRTPGAEPDYKPGVVALYEALNLPCVPLALNSGVFWPRRTLMRYPGTLVVEFLEPIPPGLPRAEFRRLLEERLETTTARLVREGEAERAAGKSVSGTYQEH